jgi:hypothetical protein
MTSAAKKKKTLGGFSETMTAVVKVSLNGGRHFLYLRWLLQDSILGDSLLFEIEMLLVLENKEQF